MSKGEGHPEKTVHLNNLKLVKERNVSVGAATLVAEENGIDNSVLDSQVVLGEEKCIGYYERELKDVLSRVNTFFSLKPGLCSVTVCVIDLIEEASPVNLLPRQIPGGIRSQVECEIEKLLKCGIIEKSNSIWASPLVPVRKKDGTIRLCVDFSALNELTPIRRFGCRRWLRFSNLLGGARLCRLWI